ncbi:hypothetical protein BDD12DRAFT_979071 [Trichophaea hybrida]|nr:hypothetical protein BDD12DRAFT_979071 [Trichophaea hybrida]
MPPKKRGKKGKRQNQPQHEQKDLEGNEQEHLQGGGASSVNPALERDGIFPLVPALSIEDYNIELGASQYISGVQSTGHRDKHRKTTAQYHNWSNGNTSTTESTRTYNESKHNEFMHSKFHGTANFGDTINYSQHRPPIEPQTRAYLERLVQTIRWDTLSHRLSVIDQDQYRSTVSPFNPNKPDNFWITKNIDFLQWESADSQALLLCAPPGHGTTEVCSHFIDLTKASQTNSSVLYFFSSTATEARRFTVFTHTLIHQIVCWANDEKASSIANTFLNTLLHGHIMQCTQVFSEDDKLDTAIDKILHAPDNVYIEALVEAIKKAGIKELSIVVDGLSEDIAELFVNTVGKQHES